MKDKVFWIMFIISIIGFIILGSIAFFYISVYNYSIEFCADRVVTALEMVVACQQLSNVTSEQVKEQYIKTFILNNSEIK